MVLEGEAGEEGERGEGVGEYEYELRSLWKREERERVFMCREDTLLYGSVRGHTIWIWAIPRRMYKWIWDHHHLMGGDLWL